MSQPNRAGGRVHPARSTIDELALHLETDLDRGLSPKAAARRAAKETGGTLFRKDGKKLTACLKIAFREPMLWILLAVCVVALFFDRVAVGLSCLILAIANGVFCAWAHHYAERVDMAMQTYDEPLTRVLRNERVVRVPAAGIVRGDIILLGRGDVVPADVRLLSSTELVVEERALDGHADEPPLRLFKAADVMPEHMPRRHSPENMIFAGAVVQRGRARALVVEVGMRTHVGAMTGGIAPAEAMRTPSAYRRVRKYLSLWNLLLAFVIVPVTAIGIFTVGSRFDLLDLFLTSLALAVVSLTEHLLAQGLFMGAWIRARAAADRDTDNAIDIKTSVDIERLGDMTHLVLLGTAGLHDGTLRPDTVHTGGQMYTMPTGEPDRAAVALSQKLYLWKKALADQGGSPAEATDLFFAIDEINRWADPDALQVRVKHLVAQWGEVAVTLGDGKIMYLRVTSDFAEVDGCERVADGHGRIPFDGTRRYDWYRAYGRAMHDGHRVYFLISEMEDIACAEGMITLSAHVCRKTVGCIRDLEEAGICVTAFLRNRSEENTRVLEACGLTAQAPASRPAEDGGRLPAFEAVQAGVRAFEGCDTAYIQQYLDAVHVAGGRVGVLSVEAEDMPLLAAADLAITCAPDLFTTSLKGEIPRVEITEGAEIDGRPHSSYATDLMRRRAHLLVRRSNVHGGGVCGVRQALLTATRFGRGLHRAVRFLLISHLLRLVAVLLPVACGLTLFSAPGILLSGLLVDLLAVICYAMGEPPLSPDDPTLGGVTKGLSRPHVTFMKDLIAAGVAAVLPWIAVGIAAWTGTSFGSTAAYVGFQCLIGTQIILFLTGQPSRRNRLTFVTTIIMVCLYVAGVAVALAGDLGVLWCLVWPCIAPLGFLAVRGIFAVIRRIASSRADH